MFDKVGLVFLMWGNCRLEKYELRCYSGTELIYVFHCKHRGRSEENMKQQRTE